ncbi:hypothetical protein DRQ36_01585 [bacterium]|nr:MAG: hypothetical protein DRQ36_01585 [bacterium]
MENEKQYWWLWDLLSRWKLLVFLPLICAVAAFWITHFFVPKWYKAEAEIMPHFRSESGMGAMANLVTGIMSLSGGGDYALPMMVTPSDLWAALVKSNAIIDTLICEFELGARYGKNIREEIRDEVKSHIETEVTGEGILIISYEDKSPEFSALVTNAIVENLDNINRNLRTGAASASREFIEERLKETETALAKAESLLAAFQKEHGAVSLEDQTRVAIENAAQLRAELLIAEVELGILTSSRKGAHSEVEDIRNRIRILKNQLEGIKTGEGIEEPFGLMEIPELALEYARLFRELTIQELLYEYLTQQYEQARIEEKKDIPILQVLSKAKVPQKKDRPKRAVIAILTLFGVFILTCLWTVGAGALERMRTNNPDDYARLVRILGGKKKSRKLPEKTENEGSFT